MKKNQGFAGEPFQSGGQRFHIVQRPRLLPTLMIIEHGDSSLVTAAIYSCFLAKHLGDHRGLRKCHEIYRDPCLVQFEGWCFRWFLFKPIVGGMVPTGEFIFSRGVAHPRTKERILSSDHIWILVDQNASDHRASDHDPRLPQNMSGISWRNHKTSQNKIFFCRNRWLKWLEVSHLRRSLSTGEQGFSVFSLLATLQAVGFDPIPSLPWGLEAAPI